MGVVAALGPRARDQTLERLLEVLDAAGLVLHRRDRRRRAGHEHGHHAVVDPGGPQRAVQAGREVDDLALALRLQPQQRGVDRHQSSRRKRRLPSCSTRPSSSAAGRSRSATGTPSSCTPPCPSVRRASERDPPNALGDQLRQVDTAPFAEAGTTRGCPSGSSRATNTRSKCASAAGGGLRAVEAGHERAREGALRVARRDVRRRRARPAAGRTSSAAPRRGSSSVLPYISSGGSVMPMWLPSDFDIFSLAVGAGRAAAWSAPPARLPVGVLDRPAHQQVERLVGAAELDVGARSPPSRSPAAPDRAARAARSARCAAKRLAKSSRSSSWATVALRTRPKSVLHRHVEPLGVVADLEPLVGAQHLARLVHVRARVARRSPRRESTGRVAERPLGSPTRAV